ncbi:hypothetical protein CRYUN_Cryun25bG0073700 [Craigia yunnanensis]
MSSSCIKNLLHSSCLKKLIYPKQEPDSAWCSLLKEENEFLKMQVIHNQAEMDALQKKLDFCLEEKEELERYVNDLFKILEEERYSRPACKSEEAEAIERAFNKQLLELYEQKAAESTYESLNEADAIHENDTIDHNDAGLDKHGEEKEVELKKVVDNLEQQLMEMHEENEKLMGLYERAMQERDEFKRMFSSGSLNRKEDREFEYYEKLVEVDGGEESMDKPHVQFEAKD